MTLGPAYATADILVAAPPELPRSEPSSLLVRLLPVVMSAATLGVMATVLLSGSPATRHPTFLAFPMMMLVALVMTAVAGRGRRRGFGIDTDRADYLGYLCGLRGSVIETAAAQHLSLNWTHPDPATLWTLIGGPRMWERRPDESDFCRIRVGVGTQPLATRLVVPQLPPVQRSDPVTVTALRRFLNAHSTIDDAPVAIGLAGVGPVVIDGDVTRVRGLLRAMICQLAVLHSPEELLIAGVISDWSRACWEWLKWLPHNQHPSSSDAVGPARMVYATPAEAQRALAGTAVPHVVVIVDADQRAGGAITGVTTLEVGAGRNSTPLVIRYSGEAETLACPDQMDPEDALACARRLAAYRVGPSGRGISRGLGWADLAGIGEVAAFDPDTLWHNTSHHDRLRVPIGATPAGAPVELDIKEPAERGMGPHGLCVGATGSGKSELLRTVALGMMARNSPEVLNLLLVDFKGGATFLDLAQAPHVAAVITNLADEAPLVARMRDALAGEMNRRQQVLRAAGNFVSVAAYELARRTGARLPCLPTLFIIVDEFSELLSQYPDFADVFLAIGRVGRSLGMHLLLASQRLDEGRLRGLDAHLSYRMCLKTLSASESRNVLGTLDAYQLPGTPGAGLLQSGAGELIRFQTAFVSGPLRRASASAVRAVPLPAVRPFTTRAVEPVTAGAGGSAGGRTDSVLRAVLDRLAGRGPAAHQVWLPPLDTSPRLGALLRDGGPVQGQLAVPIGVVDRPFEQSRTPLTVDLSASAGNVAVVGAPQTGKSTALRTLILALAASHGPGRVQFYCLDFGGGALAGVGELPHVGAVAGRAEPRLVWRMVAELESVVRSREAYFRDHGIDSIARYRQLRATSEADVFGDVFLVIDGWASLRHEYEALEESITALAVQGLSFGVHVVLSASRWAEVRPALRDQIGTRIELRLGDPADSELDRRQAQQVPRNRPGRGLSRDGLHMLIALPDLDGVEPRCGPGESVAPPIPLLPQRVDCDSVVAQAGDEHGAGVLLGLEERRLQPVAVDFERHPHLLVLGDNECGKTSALRTLCREIVRTNTAARAKLLIVDFRRTLLGVIESEHLGGYAMSAMALDALLPSLVELLRVRMPAPDVSQAQLRSRSWWSGPDIYVIVDDYDMVATSSGNPLSILLEYLPQARDLGLHLIVARRSGGAARALFEPVLASLGDLGCPVLLMSGRPEDGALFGSTRSTPLPPGRGILVTRTGDEQLVQVAWSPPR
ncbi:type VII secretion protein EccCa [Mycobacterium decipiens]|uniref:Type VII secretion protein EccC n=1 Tax=Mycobacterium decipiens TaxID=1430326 RepID=A0A1X2M088_9MYCO|nr:type VII secretion protein EccCa [Mycobacterium decipiens]OSC42972.1 type VII secretion protein EccC [Mycobacterium decipiens]